MPKIQVVNLRYTYMNDDFEGPHQLDTHHIVIQRSNAWVLIAFLFVLLLFVKAFYLCLGALEISLLSMLLGACLVKSYYWTLIEKESVLIMPAFGVQLETHYWSGRVVRNFIPVDKILKPVLNENVTPFTCYWSLALVVRGKTELMLAFKEVQPPVKLLVPIWKALCAATSCGETTKSVAEEDDE